MSVENQKPNNVISSRWVSLEIIKIQILSKWCFGSTSRFLSNRHCASAAVKLIVTRQQRVDLRRLVRGQTTDTRAKVAVGLVSLALSHDALEAGQLTALGLVKCLDANLEWERQGDGGVGRANRQGQLQAVGARDEARVESRQEELAVGVVDGKGDLELGGVLKGRDTLLGVILHDNIVHVGARVARVTASGRELFRLPGNLVDSGGKQVAGGGVVETRRTVVGRARAQVGQVVDGSGAKEGRGHELARDRVDLRRSSFGRVGEEVDANVSVRGRGLAAVGREHDGARLGRGGTQLARLGREEVLANRLGLEHRVALIAESNVERSILGGSRKHLEDMLALHDFGSGGTARNAALDSASLDSVFNLSHLGSLVISAPEANRRWQTQVLVLNSQVVALVLAGAHCQVVRDDKVEGNGVSLASLEDAALRNVRLGERHAQLHKRAERVTRVLLDKVETSGSDAGKDNVKEVKGHIASRMDNSAARDGRARRVDL